ncbi:MAG: serine hydrolase [Mycobacteriaceae bacterium]|nr:serine hydrolase [Mycobacteriaceae bacterium]
MRAGRAVTAALTALGVVVGAAANAAAAPGHPEPGHGARQCTVQSGRSPQTAVPEEVGLDGPALAQAVSFAAGRNRTNVQVYRHNCLVAAGPHNAETGHVAWNVWSVTKTVVSMVTGIAVDEGKLDIHAPIDRYLPPGVGDRAHRAIKVVDLLTETSGLRQGVATEGVTAILQVDTNNPVQALALPMDYRPGTRFVYSQRTVDLLVYVVQRAIGEDFQAFAQRKLFDPMGIHSSDYFWARDRAGNTYGYAHLMIPPDDLAKVGLLMANRGRWADRQLVSARYMDAATTPTDTNRCYGYLIWLSGWGCWGDSTGLPPGAFTASGMMSQHTLVLPHLDMMISWTGLGGSVNPDGIIGQLDSGAELIHTFMRGLLGSVRDTPTRVPGPYIQPPPRDVQVGDVADFDIVRAVLGTGPYAYPGCTFDRCLGVPLAPPFAGAPPGCLVQICLGPDPRTPGIH